MKQNSSDTILIVGAGLAGICLARRLWEEEKPFKIIDNGTNFGSRIAAGIINPLVFRRMTRSWRIDDFLPVALEFYGDLSKAWGNTYFHSIPIRRAFAHQQEHDLWTEKQGSPDFAPYMQPLTAENYSNTAVKNTFGTGIVRQSGYVRTREFLADAGKWLKETGSLLEEEFDHEQLDAVTGSYKGGVFAHIVFCEGYRGVFNPWFNYLPLQATKGEMLTIQSLELGENELLNRKCFILPIGEKKFKLGATYSWNSPNVELTQEAREELLRNADSLTSSTFEVIQQEAGVRPTVADRRPLLGTHPEYPKLKIFNGLGTKGYMTAPLLSREFSAYLLGKEALSEEVSIDRYKSRYPPL